MRVATVQCEHGAHRIAAYRGELFLEDHNIDSERVLSALGPEPPICLEILEAWRQGVGDPDMLALVCMAPSPDRDLLGLRDAARKRMQSGWVVTRSASRSVNLAMQKAAEARMSSWRRTLLSNMPQVLRFAFVLDCVAAIERSWADGTKPRDFDFDELVRSQVGNAASFSLMSWLPRGIRRLLIDVRARLAEPDEPAPEVRVQPTGGVEVVVPLRWFADVWARGLSSPDGCFVLEVLDLRSPHELLVRAIRWKNVRGVATPVVAQALVRAIEKRWRLWWVDDGPEPSASSFVDARPIVTDPSTYRGKGAVWIACSEEIDGVPTRYEGHWEAAPEARPALLERGPGWKTADEAVAWGRERTGRVYIRLRELGGTWWAGEGVAPDSSELEGTYNPFP